MNAQPEALRLADAMDAVNTNNADSLLVQMAARSAAAELRRLHEENARLRTVMVAAAEEIAAHWDAHCDGEGYGPANLMRRLEKGIASEYAYTAGDFVRLNTINSELLEALKEIEKLPGISSANLYARRAIAKAEGQ
jgi:hypothetical protein